MKSKDLIRLLQEHDPTGEMDVCVANWDIADATVVNVGYWDGCLQILERDPEDPEKIIGGGFYANRPKLDLYTVGLFQFIHSNPDFPITYDSEYAQRHYETKVEEARQLGRAAQEKRERKP